MFIIAKYGLTTAATGRTQRKYFTMLRRVRNISIAVGAGALACGKELYILQNGSKYIYIE